MESNNVDADYEEYQRNVQQYADSLHEYFKHLNHNYQDSYQHLLQYCCMYLFMSLFGKRGREGIDLIEKSDFEKKFEEDEGFYYWQRVVIRLSKNHK